jgi:signal transduction histidine kinase
MVRSVVAKLRELSHGRDRQERASILLPFVIISIGLGVLAWRSYQLSVRMEHGIETLAKQYAGYAADITARRVDSAVRGEVFRASEEWQQVERHTAKPGFDALTRWLHDNDWIVSAIYVPDADPTDSVYVTDVSRETHAARLTREFDTSSGTIRYTYNPERLLARVRSVLRQQSLVEGPDQPAVIGFVAGPKKDGLERTPAGFAYIAKLTEPLDGYAIRAFVPARYGTSAWESHRWVSLWLSVVAVFLTIVGVALAFRGLRKEAETMKLRGALIANVSHELRTPLSMIRLGAETLKRSTRLKEHERQAIEESILREVLHLSHMVENVLDVARMQHSAQKALAFTPVLPRELVTSLINTYETWISSKGFHVELHVDESIDEQQWDREAVSRALLNLIDNAIKYSDDDKRLEVVLRQTAEHVVIEVKDHGLGIASHEIARIFDPYYRAQFSDTQTRRGAGLGLTLVQQIMASHGGKIEVESQPRAGSTFRLLFPRPQQPAGAELVAGNSEQLRFVQ